MYGIQIGLVLLSSILLLNADWVEIPQLKPLANTSPKISGTTFFSESKTPMNVVFNHEQIGNVESFNTSSVTVNKRVTPDDLTLKSNQSDKNRITVKPAKSYIMEVFSSSTTQFTPLMSSISETMNNLPTTPSPKNIRKTMSNPPTTPSPKNIHKTTTVPTPKKRNRTTPTPTKPTTLPRTTTSKPKLYKNETKLRAKLENHSDGIEIEDVNDNEFVQDRLETRETPVTGGFSSYAGFLPFLKSIQSTLMLKAHKSIKSKIQVLKDLRDNLLHEIDQRIQKLWYNKARSTSEARGYKEDYSHMDFPSNEAALMTLGFLTLAVFLVKLVLKVIAAIKAKKAYYTTTTTTTMATMIKRKKRNIDELDDNLDIDATYRILSSIDKFPLKYGYN